MEEFSVSIARNSQSQEGENAKGERCRRGIALSRTLGQDGGLRQETTPEWKLVFTV